MYPFVGGTSSHGEVDGYSALECTLGIDFTAYDIGSPNPHQDNDSKSPSKIAEYPDPPNDTAQLPPQTEYATTEFLNDTLSARYQISFFNIPICKDRSTIYSECKQTTI